MTYWQRSLQTEMQHGRPAVDLLCGGLVVVALTLLASRLPGVGGAYVATVLSGYGLLALLVGYYWPRQGWSRAFWLHWNGHALLTLGAGNRVTLMRAVLVMFVLAAIPFPHLAAEYVLWLTAVTLLALCLDGLDGWVARRTGSTSAFGARFDMELDAALILGLAILLMVLERAGLWVLAIGLIRYGFALGGLVWPWLQGSLPPSFRRQFVCVWQVATLLICLPPWLPAWAMTGSLALALILLSASFMTDILWLYRHDSELESD